MTTKDTVHSYFNSLERKSGWESLLSEQMVFTSYTTPVKQVTGKDAYLEATKRFYTSVRSVTVKDVLIDGEKACALTHYELQAQNGNTFTSELYKELMRINPSPIVSLNHAAAVAMSEGFEEGLRLIEEAGSNKTLHHYHLFHAARADLLRRLDRFQEASAAYTRALSLTSNRVEQQYLRRRLREVTRRVRAE